MVVELVYGVSENRRARVWCGEDEECMEGAWMVEGRGRRRMSKRRAYGRTHVHESGEDGR